MLQAVPGDTAVDAHLGVVIPRDTLPRLIGPVARPARIQPPCAPPPLRRTIEADLHGVGIVDGDRPARGRGPIDAGPEGQRVGIRRELMNVRRNKIGDAYPDFIPCRRVSIYTMPAEVSM